MLEVEKQTNAIRFAEMGSTGLSRWGNYVDDEFLPQLTWPRAYKVYREMTDNDATIGAVLWMSEQLIRKSGWYVTAASESPADEEAAEFLRECQSDMSQGWNDILSDILSMLSYGWAFTETVYKVRGGPDAADSKCRSKYSDGRIGWRKMSIRGQSSLYGWEFAEDGDIKAMIQQAPPDFKKVTIPLSKGLLFRTKMTKDNPEGKSLLRNAYRSWYFKKRIEEIEGIGIERDLAGLPVLIPPANVDIWDVQNPQAIQAKNAAENLVQNVRRDRSEGVVIPNGWEFKLLSTGGTRQFDTNAIINRYDQRIAVTLLADLVMLGTSSVGSFALAEVKKSLLAASLEAIAHNIADTFNNYAIPQLFKMNYFPNITDYPKIVPGEIETPSLKELGDFFRATGMKIDDDYELTNYLRRIASLPEMSEETFAEIKAKREQYRNQTQNATQTHQNDMENSNDNEEYNIEREGGSKDDAEGNVIEATDGGK